jgi:hypothetical protein
MDTHAGEEQLSLLSEPGRGFRWPVSATRAIPVSSQRLWALISRPGNLEACHPFCRENPVQSWPGQGSRDEVHYLNGLVFQRHFLGWEDGRGYDLEIGRRDGAKSLVSWRIAAIDGHASALTITVCPQVLQSMPLMLRWAPHLLKLRPGLRHDLSSVVKGFEWYLIHGAPVPRNQWGSHAWFSGAD